MTSDTIAVAILSLTKLLCLCVCTCHNVKCFSYGSLFESNNIKLNEMNILFDVT